MHEIVPEHGRMWRRRSVLGLPSQHLRVIPPAMCRQVRRPPQTDSFPRLCMAPINSYKLSTHTSKHQYRRTERGEKGWESRRELHRDRVVRGPLSQHGLAGYRGFFPGTAEAFTMPRARGDDEPKTKRWECLNSIAGLSLAGGRWASISRPKQKHRDVSRSCARLCLP